MANMDITGMVRVIFMHEPQSGHRPVWRRDFDSVSDYIDSLKGDGDQYTMPDDWKRYLGRGHSVFVSWKAFLAILIASTPTEG